MIQWTLDYSIEGYIKMSRDEASFSLYASNAQFRLIFMNNAYDNTLGGLLVYAHGSILMIQHGSTCVTLNGQLTRLVNVLLMSWNM